MKKIDLGQTMTILANFGVIVGIVFLAVEINQNNSQLAAQGRNAIYQLQSDFQRDFINNVGGIADLYGKVRQGEDLTYTEQMRIASYRSHTIRTFEYMFRVDRRGAYESVDFMGVLFREPGMLQAWSDIKRGRDPEFVEFIDQVVIAQRDSLDR